MARTDSDIDIGLYYSESAPLSVRAVREVASGFPGAEGPVVAELFEWGPWVNGGAWLTIAGQRVDLIYRSLEQLERVIVAAERGDHDRDFGQQPPFGFFGPTYLGELAIAVPLSDPTGRIAALNRRYFVNDETALDETAGFAPCPAGFRGRVEALLASVGSTPTELEHAVAQASGLCREVVGLASELYVPRIVLPAPATAAVGDDAPRRA